MATSVSVSRAPDPDVRRALRAIERANFVALRNPAQLETTLDELQKLGFIERFTDEGGEQRFRPRARQ